MTAVGIKFVRPGHAQLRNRVGIDLSQGAEALFRIGPSIGHPVAAVGIGRGQANGIDLARLRAGLTCC